MIFPEGVLSVETDADRRALARGSGSRVYDLNSPEIRALFAADMIVGGPSILSTSEVWKSSPTVRACIEAIASTLSQLPFKMYRKRGDTFDEIHKHALLDIIARPNRELGLETADLLMQTFAIRELFGEAFWVLERNVKGRAGSPVKNIWVWHPGCVKEVRDPYDQRKLIAWELNFEGKKETFDLADVIHFPRYDPMLHAGVRPSRGRSALGSAALTVSADIAAQKYNLGFFDRNATPDGVYSTEGDLDQETEDRILDRVKAKLAHKSHEPIILSNGLKFAPTHTTPRDAEFVNGRKMNREEILMAFRVPPVVIGLLEFSSYANADAQLRLWWDLCLKPIIASFCGALKSKLIPEMDVVCALSTEGVQVLKGDVHKAIESGVKLAGVGVPWNVIDGLLDIGTGPIPGGDTGYVSFGLVPMDQVADVEESVTPVTKTEPAVKADDATKIAPPADDKDDAARRVPLIVAPTPADLDRFALQIISPNRAAAADIFNAMLAKLIAAIRKTDGDLKDRTKKLYEKAFETGIGQMGALIGTGVQFGLDDPDALRFIADKLVQITGINDSTEKKIRAAIANAIDSGATLDDFASDLKKSFNFSSSRARLIARTEVSQTVNGGRYAALENEGTERHEWLDSNDDRVRDTHSQEDGHIVAVGDTFPVTGLRYPGDELGEASEVISCRCVSLPASTDRALKGDARRTYWRATTDAWAPIETKFWKAIKRTLHEQRSAVLEIIANTKE